MKLALFLAVILATNAHAMPTVSIHWSDCTSTTVNRSLADGRTATVVVTATGLSGPVKATGVTVSILHRGFTGLADFWRFDEAGCAAGRMTATSGGASGCPRLAVPTAELGKFQLGEVGGGAFHAALFDPVTADPNATYTIATFTFDLSSETCACPDQAQCLHVGASWLDEAGEEHSFWPEQEYVTWNDPYDSTCGGPPLCGNPDDCIDPPNPCAANPTPVRAQSWGRVKASYR